MFDIEATTTIDSSPERVWNYLVDIQRWWLPSNPDHESLEILAPNGQVMLGTTLRIRERIAGILGEATGVITEFVPGQCATWQAKASYRLLWKQVAIEEGVTWSVRPSDGGTELSAHVWARFPNSFMGRLSEWLFLHVLNGTDKDRQHAEAELRYIRTELEKLPITNAADMTDRRLL